ncbi:hypothetical protein ABZX12_02815 [Kribbella sp. NPDC003505]|uniref:hypothetical protein n=1 Tax=Kribbella sp. NPDC003505 TaxID=3154448 RepID=UPI0033A70357
MAITMWVRAFGAAPGERLAEGNRPWTPPYDLLTPEETPLLYGVDPYDDTIFNRRQCERLLMREVTHLRTQRLAPDQIAMLDELDRLILETNRSPHRYLLFNGD